MYSTIQYSMYLQVIDEQSITLSCEETWNEHCEAQNQHNFGMAFFTQCSLQLNSHCIYVRQHADVYIRQHADIIQHSKTMKWEKTDNRYLPKSTVKGNGLLYRYTIIISIISFMKQEDVCFMSYLSQTITWLGNCVEKKCYESEISKWRIHQSKFKHYLTLYVCICP